MKISGFTIVRNAQLMGYPAIESIRSLLPLVDEYVIGLGQSDDQTREMIESLNDPKIKIFDSYWDPKPSGGKILSEKTNEALAKCENNWCFYLQCDEVIHERDIVRIHKSMEAHENDPDVQGLLFDYIHFYGSYDVIAQARNWYRREVRVVKKNSGIQSWQDAQGFRINGKKPKVKFSGASVYHYGWVKPPQQMGQKKKLLDRLWHGEKKDAENESFSFKKQYGLKKFKGVHPSVMLPRVRSQDWKFDPKKQVWDWTLKDWNYFGSDVFEKAFRFRLGEYKSYELLK
jgi:hypothetical protein